MLPRVIAIVGVTASGKSAAAQSLAQRLGGEIVNGDSRQVYRGMDIGTAKPSREARHLVRHHLYDIADPTSDYSVALFRRDARVALEEIAARGTFAWLVGGTGQYVWALLEDWHVPEVPPDEGLRTALTAIAEERGPDVLHERLAAVDPIAARRIDARNVRRVVRAIEVFEQTGVPISTWQTRGKPGFEYLLFGLDVERSVIDARIDRRVEDMFASGFVAEVQDLVDRGVTPDAPAMSSIGYEEIMRHLRGEVSLNETKELTKRATRRLARRQRQWFRGDDPRITWVRDVDTIDMQANVFASVCSNAILRPGR